MAILHIGTMKNTQLDNVMFLYYFDGLYMHHVCLCLGIIAQHLYLCLLIIVQIFHMRTC